MSKKTATVGKIKHEITHHSEIFGIFVDMSNANWEQLAEAINDEWACGHRGDILDVATDLDEQYGISTFGIYPE